MNFSRNHYVWGLLAVGLVSLSSSTAAFAQRLSFQRVSFQQASAVSAVYGRGVHAYFAGNSSQAEQYFTQAIQSGSSDPRPYYFRAMLRLGLGRQLEAENDMRVGASLEARNPGVQHSIGRALQRVQGPGRRTLEKFRRQASLDRLQQGKQQSQQRYEQLDRRGPAVLRSAEPLPLEQPVRAPQGLALPDAAQAVAIPGPLAPPPPIQAPSLSAPQPLQPATAQPAIAQPLPAAGSGTKPEEDLFGSPAPVTSVDDPFGAAPALEPTPAPTPAPPEADPFGELPSPAPQPETEESDENDPFGDSSEPVEEEPAEGDEPFGEAMEEESEPAEESEESPAEEDQPASESDDDDPFGDF